MSKHCFSDTQVKELAKNPNVKNVTNKAITYQKSFKELFLREYYSGKSGPTIFEEAGFDLDTLGNHRVKSSRKLWRAQNKRLEGLNDTRKNGSGRPRTKEFTQDEIIERQRAQIEFLTQERDFLLELERLERQVIRKQTSSQKTNLNSSKK